MSLPERKRNAALDSFICPPASDCNAIAAHSLERFDLACGE